MDLFNSKGAEFSSCRAYRYTLWRWWEKSKGYALFIGLNPSTADETQDDPTIRRCINFAKSWGYGGYYMANLFAIRATDPKVMLRHPEPVGQDNTLWIRQLSLGAGIVIAAWGTQGGHRGRDRDVMGMLGTVHCLDITKHGFPKHPLYVRGDTRPKRYTGIPVDPTQEER